MHLLCRRSYRGRYRNIQQGRGYHVSLLYLEEETDPTRPSGDAVCRLRRSFIERGPPTDWRR